MAIPYLADQLLVRLAEALVEGQYVEAAKQTGLAVSEAIRAGEKILSKPVIAGAKVSGLML